MSDEQIKLVLIERVDSLYQQVRELLKGIPSDPKKFKFVKGRLEGASDRLGQALYDLKFTPQEEA